MDTPQCEYCGPTCYRGAAHNARVEDGVRFGTGPGEMLAAAPRVAAVPSEPFVWAPPYWNCPNNPTHELEYFPHWTDQMRCKTCLIHPQFTNPLAAAPRVEEVPADHIGEMVPAGVAAMPAESTPEPSEQVAHAMCCIEHRTSAKTLDSFYSEVDRTWKRHIPEANALIAELGRHGLRVVDAASPEPKPAIPDVPYEEHEREVLKVCQERDEAEDAIGEAYWIVTGQQAEWSNLFGYSEALEGIKSAMPTQAEPKPAMPSELAREIITRLVTKAIQSTVIRNLAEIESEIPSEKELIVDALAVALGEEVGCLSEEEWTSEHIDLIWLEEKLAAAMPTQKAADHNFDLVKHLHRQREFSSSKFGPITRKHGVVDHIRKELVEIEQSPADLSEWVDVIILGFDGAWRSGAEPEDIVAALVSKQEKNEKRTWPDWRTAEDGKAIEHVRAAPPESKESE